MGGFLPSVDERVAALEAMLVKQEAELAQKIEQATQDLQKKLKASEQKRVALNQSIEVGGAAARVRALGDALEQLEAEGIRKEAEAQALLTKAVEEGNQRWEACETERKTLEKQVKKLGKRLAELEGAAPLTGRRSGGMPTIAGEDRQEDAEPGEDRSPTAFTGRRSVRKNPFSGAAAATTAQRSSVVAGRDAQPLRAPTGGGSRPAGPAATSRSQR